MCSQLSASPKPSTMHSAVNRPPSPLAKTSPSLEDIAPLLPVSISHSLLALYTKLLAGKCLIHIGREGVLGSLTSGKIKASSKGSKAPMGIIDSSAVVDPWM